MGTEADGARDANGVLIPPMAFDELQSCVDYITQMQRDKANLSRAAEEVEAERARVRRLGDSLETARPRVDVKSPAQVDAFNAGITSHKAMIVSFNELVVRINGDAEKAKAHTAMYNTRCAGRPYRRSHFQALSPEQKRIIEANSTSDPASARKPQ